MVRPDVAVYHQPRQPRQSRSAASREISRDPSVSPPEHYQPLSRTSSPAASGSGSGSHARSNPYGKFPVVGALAAGADPNLGYDSAAMKHCRDAYTAETGKTVLPLTEEQKTGKSTGFVALQQTCAELQMFVAGANKAGANLTPDTWLKGLESVGKIELALAPQSSFAPGKPDGQDSFQLVKFNPAYKTGSSVPEFIPVGAPITLGS